MGVRAEERAAKKLGVARVHRRRGESAPDIGAVRTSSGTLLGCEIKARSRLPALVVGALKQARRYWGSRALPVAIIFEKGSTDGIACLDLTNLVWLLGIDVATLPAPRPLRRTSADPRQIELFTASGGGS